ncbi:SAV_2336 N-terminal domain-related protein [Kitasatospora griseola]|uniref:SAV_2336 N-terminal domain-related protein n=1 Tax=Kitasatospora griseola TaxID=2064 RepID=UPI003817BBFF
MHPDTAPRVLAALAEAGLDLDAHALLDALWLADRLRADRARATGAAEPEAAPVPVTDSRPEPPSPSPSPKPTLDAAADGDGSPPDEPSPQAAEPDGLPLHSAARPAADRARRSGGGGHSLRVPEPKELPQERLLARSLRPLRQHRPSSHHRFIDERASAEAIAESRQPIVVLRPARERWLRCLLVVDDGVSMLLWRRLVAELSDLLQHTGAFRQIQHLGLRSRGPDPIALRPRPFTDAPATIPTRAVVDPTGQTLVIVVSDGAGLAWRDGRMRRVLGDWGRIGPLAVVHTLPRRLWAGTGLAARHLSVRAERRGAANHTWTVRDPLMPWFTGGPADGPVPVLELTPAALADWARLLSAGGAEVELPLWQPSALARPADAPSAAGVRARPGGAPAPARALQRFVAGVSPTAHRLAAHLAALAPVSVPVMRLAQSALDPTGRAGSVPLAEVFLGGLLRPVPPPPGQTFELPPNQRLFDFPAAVKDELFAAFPTGSLVAVTHAVSARITSLAGTSPDFPAWLANPRLRGGPVPDGTAFATLGPALLRHLGVSLESDREPAATAAEPAVVEPTVSEPDELVEPPVTAPAEPEPAEPAATAVAEPAASASAAAADLPPGLGVAMVVANGMTYSVVHDRRSVRLWPPDSYSPLSGRRTEFPQGVSHVEAAVVKGHPHALVCTDSGSVEVWSMVRWQREYALTGHDLPVTFVTTAVLDRRLHAITASADGTARIWDLVDGSCRNVLTGHRGPVTFATTTVFERRPHAITTSADGTARVWDLTGGTCRNVLTGHRGPVTHAAVTTVYDRTYVFTASADDTCRGWDLLDGQSKIVMSGHTKPVNRIALNIVQGQPQAVTISDDGTARVWSANNGRCRRILTGHTGPVTQLVVGADGATAITVSDDRTVRRWELSSGFLYGSTAVPDGHIARTVTHSGAPHVLVADANRRPRLWNPDSIRTRPNPATTAAVAPPTPEPSESGARPRPLTAFAVGGVDYRILNDLDGLWIAQAIGSDTPVLIRTRPAAEDRNAVLAEEPLRPVQPHPHLLPLLAMGVDADQAYTVSAWGTGRALSRTISSGAVATVTIGRRLRWLAQIATALAALHRAGEVHGSLSPQEVLIDDRGNARITTPSPMDRTGAPLWHAAPYAAPERQDGREGRPDGDLYSLGRVALALVSGALLAPATAPPSDVLAGLRSTVSEPVRELIADLTDPDPARRPGSAEDVAESFQQLSLLPVLPVRPALPDVHLSRTRADAAWASWIEGQLSEHYAVETVLLDSDTGPRLPVGPVRNAERTVLLLSRTAVARTADHLGWWEQVAAAAARGNLLLLRVDDVETPAALTTTPVLDLLGAAEQDTRTLLLDAVAALTGGASPPEGPAHR